MWQNLQWLRAEWRYYFEWRRLRFAAKLEGKEEMPERNAPLGYTFRWLGVVVMCPTIVISLLGVIVWSLYTNPDAMKIAFGVLTILFMVAVVLWVIFSLVSMSDHGPSHVVEQHWKRTHGKGSS